MFSIKQFTFICSLILKFFIKEGFLMKISDKRVYRTKKTFRAALLILLKKKHFENITVTDIVKQAEYNRGTFYNHFEQKEDLLNEMINMMLQDMGDSFRKPYMNLEKEVNIVELSTIALFDHFIENKDFYKVILGPNVNLDFHDKMVRSMEKHFKKDITFITNNVDSEIDLKLFYHYRVHGIIGLIMEWIKSDFQHSKQYMADQIVKIATLHTEKIYVQYKDT